MSEAIVILKGSVKKQARAGALGWKPCLKGLRDAASDDGVEGSWLLDQ